MTAITKKLPIVMYVELRTKFNFIEGLMADL